MALKEKRFHQDFGREGKPKFTTAPVGVNYRQRYLKIKPENAGNWHV
jgi:hypothetical protein